MDQAQFDHDGALLKRLELPQQCWDGGPIDARSVDRVFAYNRGVKVGEVAYPLYQRDPFFDQWRNAANRTESERHQANCLVTDRWTMRVAAVADSEQREAVTELRTTVRDNVQFETRWVEVERAERRRKREPFRPRQVQAGPDSARKKSRKRAEEYDLDRQAILLLCLHDKYTLDGAIRERMKARGLKDRQNYLSRLGGKRALQAEIKRSGS